MIVESVELKRVDKGCNVVDCFVGKGLLEGGHSALPDIDVDFASDRRHEIKTYLEGRYNVNGRQRVFSAGTFSGMKLKAVIKDVARVYRVPLGITNYITSIISDEQSWDDLIKLAAKNKKINKFVQTYPFVIEDIRTIMGLPRSTSIHASAIVITPERKDGEFVECFDYLPLRKMDGLLVSEFDGYAVEEIGLLKEDVLATKELAKLSGVIRIVNEVYGKEYTIEKITQEELHDSKTYAMLRDGFTQNVFQFSSKGITRFIMDVGPSSIEDLIAINALYRPATLDIGATEDYIRYKRGDVVPVYNFGTYEATKNTFGIMCYQEQFMSIAHTLGGFDLGKTDYLRKAIGKKNAELMATLKEDFLKGATANGCPDYEAEEIWHKIEIAGKYSFNRSHAAAYALTAYCGAWLKANYPTAFYTVALQYADDKEITSIMSEMEQCSLAKIVPPDINNSGMVFYTDYETDEIFWSLQRIKMLGIKTVECIVKEREVNGEFASVENFIHRIFKNKLDRRVPSRKGKEEENTTRTPVDSRHLKHLISAGCFDKVSGIKSGTERFSILSRASELLGFSLDEKEFPVDMRDKHYFWSMLQVDIASIGNIDYERIYNNSEVKGMIKGKVAYLSLSEALKMENEGRKVAVCATVTELEERSYKDKESGEQKYFCKMKLQQNNSMMEVVIWNDLYATRKEEINGLRNKVIVVTAVIKYYGGTNSLNTYRTSVLQGV